MFIDGTINFHGDVSGKWRNRTARIENYVNFVEGMERILFMLMCRKSGGIEPHELKSTVVISKLR